MSLAAAPSGEELQAVNAKIAAACISGRLDKNPFMQGLLCQCLSKLDKESRGVGTAGRVGNLSETEHRLLNNAAMTLAIAGGNRLLCEQLGQKATPPRVRPSELPEKGLPDPVLSLMDSEKLAMNFDIIDACYDRSETARSRRLICAVDATYLLKSLSQYCLKGKAGLVGGPWSAQDETRAFLEITKGNRSAEKAPLMLEFLLWHPCATHRDALSAGSMPISLAAPRQDASQTLLHAGNFDAWLN